MKLSNLSRHGAWVGAKCSATGGAVFAVFVLMIGYKGTSGMGADWAGAFFSWFMVFMLSLPFAIIPGAVGGAHLANWLGSAERKKRTIQNYSCFVGACSGLAADILALALFFRFEMDAWLWTYAFIALGIATWMGWVGAQKLMKRLDIVVSG